MSFSAEPQVPQSLGQASASKLGQCDPATAEHECQRSA